jgi:hypothetical protein
MTDSGDKAYAPAREGASDNGTLEQATSDKAQDDAAANPPRTTSFGWLTVPKFGSAGSGRAELEPVLERG